MKDLVIGIDMDDTICSTNERIIVEADKYDKEVLGGTGVKNVKAYEFNDMLGWDPEMKAQFFKDRLEYIMGGAEIKEDAKRVINKMHDKMMKSKNKAMKSFEDYEVMIQAWREPGMENSKQIIMGDKISIATVLCSLMENMILNKIFTIDELYSLVDSVKEVMSDDNRRDV